MRRRRGPRRFCRYPTAAAAAPCLPLFIEEGGDNAEITLFVTLRLHAWFFYYQCKCLQLLESFLMLSESIKQVTYLYSGL